MKLPAILALASASAFIAAAGTATAQQQDKASQPEKAESAKAGKRSAKSDADHLKKLAQANIAEIQAGKLAMEKASDEKVKEFGQKMVDDHTKLLGDLKKVAAAENVQLPSAPDAKHQKLMKRLQSLSGEKFDRAYMQAMVKDHKQAISLLNKTEKASKDEDVKAAAEQAEPEIRNHLDMAQQIAGTGKRSASGKTRGSKAGAGEDNQAGAAR